MVAGAGRERGRVDGEPGANDRFSATGRRAEGGLSALPLCLHCFARPVKRRDKKYCSLTCRDAAAVKRRPVCAHCTRRPVKRLAQRYCSLACGHASLKVQRRFCAAKCGARVKQKKARFCSKSCAWRMRGGGRLLRKLLTL